MKFLAGILPLVLAVNACSLVVSERAVGEKAVPAAGFEGTWAALADEKGFLELSVKDAEAGVVTAKDDDGGEVFELRERHGWIFANRVVADAGATGFAWHRVEMAPDGRSFRVWTPDPSAFEDLITAGTLKGRIIQRGQAQAQPGAPANRPAQNPGASGTIVVISEKDDDWIRKMMEGRFGDVFDSDSPVTYVRIPEQALEEEEDPGE